MTDSITISKSITISESNDVINHLENVGEVAIRETGEYIASGWIGSSMKVIVRGESLSIRGSLSQFYKSNTSSILFSEIPLAIEKLNNMIGLNLEDGELKRIDLESTFPVNHLVKSYFEYLGRSNYYTRFIEGNSLYYATRNRKICIYDKGKKNKRDAKGNYSFVGNLMRFETRFNKGYIKQIEHNLKLPKLKVSNLYDAKIQMSLLNLWLNEFKNIQQHPKLYLEMKSVGGLADFRKMLESKGIEELGGVANVIEMLERAKSMTSELDSKGYSRIKTYLKKFGDNALHSKYSSHLADLNLAMALKYFENYISINESR